MWDWISRLEELRRQGRPAVLVTVTGSTGSTPREAGAKMIVLDDAFDGTIGGGHLEELAIADARRLLASPDGGGTRRLSPSQVIRYPLGAKTGQCCGGTIDLFFEVLQTGPRFVLFGAGHVGQAVCRALSGTPFRVQLIDERDEWISSPALPREVVRHACEWDDFARGHEFSPDDFYAVMTHRHDTDQEIIAHLIRKPARYIGLIGSRSKWERFKQRLLARGFTEEELARVRCPLGIDVGGKAPQEIAISLAAELLKIHYER